MIKSLHWGNYCLDRTLNAQWIVTELLWQTLWMADCNLDTETNAWPSILRFWREIGKDIFDWVFPND